MPRLWVNSVLLLAAALTLQVFAAASLAMVTFACVLEVWAIVLLGICFRRQLMNWNSLPTPRAALFSLALMMLVVVAISSGHCTPTSPRHENSLGTVMYQDNPNSYIMGAIVGGAIVSDGHNVATNLRLQPSYTYNLFTQEVLICDAPSQELANASVGGPLVLTYETQAHHMVSGIGCHRLVAISEVKSKELK